MFRLDRLSAKDGLAQERIKEAPRDAGLRLKDALPRHSLSRKWRQNSSWRLLHRTLVGVLRAWWLRTSHVHARAVFLGAFKGAM